MTQPLVRFEWPLTPFPMLLERTTTCVSYILGSAGDQFWRDPVADVQLSSTASEKRTPVHLGQTALSAGRRDQRFLGLLFADASYAG